MTTDTTGAVVDNPGDVQTGQPEPVDTPSSANDFDLTSVAGVVHDNALKAISKTDEELRVGNYLVMFGGRDLEGEYFTDATDLESDYTKSGQLVVDWEHRRDDDPDGPQDKSLGFVDWATAQKNNIGLWVERVLDRRNEYVKYLERLIEEGLIGNSSEAIPERVEKAKTGEIRRWPLRRDTLTVTPMEPRMLTQNALSALKALGVLPESSDEPDAETSNRQRLAVAKAKARLQQLKLEQE